VNDWEADTTGRIRFSDQTSAEHEWYSPGVPELPVDTIPEWLAPADEDQTIPDHGMHFSQLLAEPQLEDRATTEPRPRAEARSPRPARALARPPTRQIVRGPETPQSGSIMAERYSVVREVGSGGMGTVYEVTHVRLGKTFALKLMHGRVAANEEIRKGFFREAKFASSIDHPNILSVVDFGEDSRYGPYIVSEYLEGEQLATLLSRKAMSSRRAFDIILQLAEGLQCIHNHGIVHCDIKTKNIIVGQDPGSGRRRAVVKLLDFGLARSMSQKVPERVFGTPEYLPPEIAGNKKATARSDIYSIGILLFELIAGSVPFRGSTSEILRAHRDSPMPTAGSRLGQNVDPAIERLIATATQKVPGKRHKNMDAFIYELRTVMDMLGLPRSRRGGSGTALPIPVPDRRTSIACATFDHFRLPIATIGRDGVISAANAAFSKFVNGMMVRVEGTRIQDTLLARAWSTLEDDLAAACGGQPIGRSIEIDTREGPPACLQMWLEPTGVEGYACFAVYPLSPRG